MYSGDCQLHIGTCSDHLPSTSTKIKAYAATAADFSVLPERSSVWRAEMRYCVLGEKTGRTGLLIDRYFQELIL